MEAAYSDDPDPERDAYAAGVAAGPTSQLGAPQPTPLRAPPPPEWSRSSTWTTMRRSRVVEGDEEVQLAVRRLFDSFRAQQKELDKQEAADLERATKESLIYARRKRYCDGAASSPEEGTGSSR